jgi:hypothetical protein
MDPEYLEMITARDTAKQYREQAERLLQQARALDRRAEALWRKRTQSIETVILMEA